MADVASEETDPGSEDNHVSETTTVNPAAALALTSSADPVLVGASPSYTVTVSNSGPSEATEVTLTDTLPEGADFVSATPSQGICSRSGSTVTCALGSLASGENATVTIAVAPVSPGDLTHTASVTSSVADPRAEDDATVGVAHFSFPTSRLGITVPSTTLGTTPLPPPTGGEGFGWIIPTIIVSMCLGLMFHSVTKAPLTFANRSRRRAWRSVLTMWLQVRSSRL